MPTFDVRSPQVQAVLAMLPCERVLDVPQPYVRAKCVAEWETGDGEIVRLAFHARELVLRRSGQEDAVGEAEAHARWAMRCFVEAMGNGLPHAVALSDQGDIRVWPQKVLRGITCFLRPAVVLG